MIKSQLQELFADAKALGRAHLELLQLNLVDQAIPKVAHGIYAVGILVLLNLLLLFGLITAGLAISLLFALKETYSFVALQALTYGFLSLWGLLLFFTLIVMSVKKPLIRRFETSAYKSYLDNLDDKKIG